MSAGLTVVAICRSLGALHCFPGSRGSRDAAASRAVPNGTELTSADSVLSCPSPLPSACPLLAQMVWDVNWEEKAKDEQRAEAIFPKSDHSSGWQHP